MSLKDTTFTWKDESDDNPTLQNITVDVRHGELLAVVGVVGSGKSSLLSGLLGDMLKLKGSVAVSVSYLLYLKLSVKLFELMSMLKSIPQFPGTLR